MLHKNLPVADKRAFLIKRRLLDTIAWAKFVLTLDMPNAAAIVRAHRDFARMRREYKDTPTSPIPPRPNILVEYYLRGHKTYDSL